MDTPFLQLAYISSCRGAIDGPLLQDVLARSRRNNDRVGITGLLVSGGKRFLQVLEGPEAAVMATYARIQADPRHRALVLISRRHVPERAFGRWAMAARTGDGESDDGLETHVEALIAKVSDPNLRAQFTGFARLHNRAA